MSALSLSRLPGRSSAGGCPCLVPGHTPWSHDGRHRGNIHPAWVCPLRVRLWPLDSQKLTTCIKLEHVPLLSVFIVTTTAQWKDSSSVPVHENYYLILRKSCPHHGQNSEVPTERQPTPIPFMLRPRVRGGRMWATVESLANPEEPSKNQLMAFTVERIAHFIIVDYVLHILYITKIYLKTYVCISMHTVFRSLIFYQHTTA